MTAHILFPRLAHDSRHHFALLVENHRPGHNIAQPEPVHRVRIGIHPAFQRDMQPLQHCWNLRPILHRINRDQREPHRLARIARRDLSDARLQEVFGRGIRSIFWCRKKR